MVKKIRSCTSGLFRFLHLNFQHLSRVSDPPRTDMHKTAHYPSLGSTGDSLQGGRLADLLPVESCPRIMIRQTLLICQHI